MRLALILVTAPLLLGACESKWERDGKVAVATGQGATRNFDARDFTAVDLRGPDDVEVRAGSSWSVRAEGDPKTLDELEIQVVDGTLRIGRKGRNGIHWNSGNGIKVAVTLPKLTGASIAGSGNLNADRAEGDFNGDIAGSGDLSVAALRGGAAKLSIAGSGDIKVGGQASQLSANIAGSGSIDGSGLTATGADVSIAGSGGVRAIVKGEASVSIIGSGDVELTGGARCSVNRIGSGDAKCS